VRDEQASLALRVGGLLALGGASYKTTDPVAGYSQRAGPYLRRVAGMSLVLGEEQRQAK
jgi:hypothetical protein